MRQEQRVQYLQQGTLGPLTTKECQILRDILRENPDELSQAQETVLNKFVDYLNGVIESNTTVGKIV